MSRAGTIAGLPVISRKRVVIALVTAAVTDLFQLALGPLGVTFADEILDVIAMVITTAVLGFHPLLLPTFLVELVPVVDLLPTWTGCVLLVVALRRRNQKPFSPEDNAPPEPGSSKSNPPIIDI